MSDARKSDARDELPPIARFPVLCAEKTRFGDTDAFGHINNAVVSTFLESGRGELLRHGQVNLAAADCRFVVVRSEIDFVDELQFPGDVLIGSAVAKIGRSSLTFEQAIFQHGICRVVSRSVLVHSHAKLKASAELTAEARAHFARLVAVSA
jgi:acyl-CoA thioester hydrolase